MPSENGNIATQMSDPTAEPQLNLSTSFANNPISNGKAVVVGLYGVPGSGKTFILSQPKQELREEHFSFYEGSEKIAAVVPGGLETFQKLDEREQVRWRQLAIDTIGKECAESGRVAVVTGHFMFWFETEEAGRPVYTQNDLDTFTHILYLDVPEDIVLRNRLEDTSRRRSFISSSHIRRWQQTEKSQLRELCGKNGILFSLLYPWPTMLDRVLMLLRDFKRHNEKHNLSVAENMLDEFVAAGQGQLETMLVLDADKTLSAADSGLLFWESFSRYEHVDGGGPLKKLFSGPLGYTYTAFRQATLLYEEAAEEQGFDEICAEVASAVKIYPEFLFLLQQVGEKKHVGAVVVTCGIRRVWEKVLESEGLSETVRVIGGGCINDGLVVTAAVKAALVSRLRDVHKLYTWAFGDSPLDLDMLKSADQAIVVVGKEQTRSKSMDVALTNALENDALQARQLLLPSTATPRLDTFRLPVVQLTEPNFLNSILCHRSQHVGIQLHHATNRNATKLLMTPMRNANVSGPVLREAHRRVGQYLATEFLPIVIGVEEYPIPHVQGNDASGYRLLDEKKTSIVALMRGGEPMAFGVNDICPLAMFVHASRPEDIKLHHLQGQRTVVLVDSVVNNGQTVVQFVQRIRELHRTIRIVVVAGVVQAKSVSDGGLIQSLASDTHFSIIALRMSENKFTGRSTTDTGNRLFNTTHVL